MAINNIYMGLRIVIGMIVIGFVFLSFEVTAAVPIEEKIKIPEFPNVILPVIVIFTILFIMQRKK